MLKEELIAPQKYNLVSEVERFSKDSKRIALQWVSEFGETRQITYAQLIQRVNQIGNLFLQQGLKKSEVVLIMAPRIIEAYEVYLAALKVGLVVIPCSEMLREKDLTYRIHHGDVKAVISYSHYADQFESISNVLKFSIGQKIDGWIFLEEEIQNVSDFLQMADTNREDMAFLSYTSGTTGNPKGVVHTHGWAFAHLKTAAQNWLGIEDGDTVWATAGPGWQKWIWSPFLSVLGTGATGFVYYGKFDPKTYLTLIEKYHINVLCCTPTEYRLMAKVENLNEYRLSYLKNAVSAGEPLNREVIDTFKNFFNIEVRDGYGQTENTLLVGITKGMPLKPGSMGKPTLGNCVEIIDGECNICPVGRVGDIAVHVETPALFKNYYKDPERTARQFRGDYYITGDRAKKDEDGYFWFEGRGDDIIISSGYTIGPFEVEDALVKHPLVKECAVVASPDEVRGSIVKAFIVLQEHVNPNEALTVELQDHVKRLTAPYKYPRKIEYVHELPKTTSGKIRRIELRQKELKTT